MTHNRATIYSNGIADFQRIFPLAGNRTHKISIPVCQQHLADMLASLMVSGDVRIAAPPSFQPANIDDSQIILSSDDSFVTLAHQLKGAEVEISVAGQTIVGRLLGTQDQQTGTGGEPISETSIVISANAGIRQVAVHQIENLRFTDAVIRAEIEKSLNQSLQEIKPNSTCLELKLRASKKTNAIVQYTLPAAAWKLCYRLIISENSRIELHGYAVVDNNTDEDWKDYLLAVVMGQPISFSTDIADSKTPRRSHVDLVPESALGNVEVEPLRHEGGFDDSFAESSGIPENLAASEPMMAMAKSLRADGKPTSRQVSAEIEEVDISEAGDFCRFESSTPVSIEARRSAMVPMFQAVLDESKPALHYCTENHPERPFRSIQFTNTTPHGLAKGVCTVYDEETYAGNCVLPNTSVNETRLLPHALESAVRVGKTTHRIKTRRIGLRISEGIVYEKFHKAQSSEYTIRNFRDESFQFVLDHQQLWGDGGVECQLLREGDVPVVLVPENLSSGYRVEFELQASDAVTASWIETCVTHSRVSLIGESSQDGPLKTHWLIDNLIESNMDLGTEPEMSNILELQRQLDEQESRIRTATEELKRLTARQQRLRENIKAGTQDQRTAKWREDLDKSEDRIVLIEEQNLPGLLLQRDQVRTELFDALAGLSFEWSG